MGKIKVISTYKELNTIPIPKRGILLTVIQEDLWYIIWEKNLLKPKVFRYAFASYYHAKKFAQAYMGDFLHNILEGKVLISYGFDTTNITLSHAMGEKNEHKMPTKYYLHPELSKQRKKTLRNLYRRNTRRLLKKLLLLNNKENNGYIYKD